MKRILDRRFGWSLMAGEVRMDAPDADDAARRQIAEEEARRAEERRAAEAAEVAEERRRTPAEQEREDEEAARRSGFGGVVSGAEQGVDVTGTGDTGGPRTSATAGGSRRSSSTADAGDTTTHRRGGATVRRGSTSGSSGTSSSGSTSSTGTATRGGGTAHGTHGTTGAARTESAPPSRYTGQLREDGTPADAVTVDEEPQGLVPNFGDDEIVEGRPDLQTLLAGTRRRATARYNREHSTAPKKEETKLPPERDFRERQAVAWTVSMTPESQQMTGERVTRIPSRPKGTLDGTPMQGVYQFEGDLLANGGFVAVAGGPEPNHNDWVGYIRGTMNDPNNYPQPIRVFSREFPEYMQNRFYDWVVTDEDSGRPRSPEEALNFVHQFLVGNEILPERFQPREWEVAELNHQLTTVGTGNKPADVTKAEELYAEKQRGLTADEKRKVLSTTDAKEAIRLLEGKGADLQTSEEIFSERAEYWLEDQKKALEEWGKKRDKIELITDPDDPRARQLAILEAVSVDLPAEGRKIAEKREATEAFRTFYDAHASDFTYDNFDPATQTEYNHLISAMESAGVEPEILEAFRGQRTYDNPDDGSKVLTEGEVADLYLGEKWSDQEMDGISNLSEQEQQVKHDIARLEAEVDPAIMEPLVEDVGFLQDYDRFASALNDGRYAEMRTLHQKQFGNPGGFNDRNVTADGREYYREQRKNRRTEDGERMQAFQNAAGAPAQIGQQISTLAGLPDTIGKALRNLGETLGLDLTDAQLQTYLGRIDKYATGKDSRRNDLLTKRLKVEKRDEPVYKSQTALEDRVKNYVVDGQIKDFAKVDEHAQTVAQVGPQEAQRNSTVAETEQKGRKRRGFVTPPKTWIEV